MTLRHGASLALSSSCWWMTCPSCWWMTCVHRSQVSGFQRVIGLTKKIPPFFFLSTAHGNQSYTFVQFILHMIVCYLKARITSLGFHSLSLASILGYKYTIFSNAVISVLVSLWLLAKWCLEQPPVSRLPPLAWLVLFFYMGWVLCFVEGICDSS